MKSVKRKMQNHNLKFKTYLILSFTLLLCAFSFSFSAFAAEPNRFSTKVTEVAGDPRAQIERICSAIYKGDFAGAREVLGGSSESESTAIRQLIDIISEYEAIEAKRRTEREAAYREQLAELERLRVEADTNDVNDVNDVIKVLSVIAKTSELAEQSQMDELLSKPFVKKVFQKAIDKAAEFESKGDWLDAYASCYSWLQAIDKDNEAYSDYADQLFEKANILVFFRDSPCESRKERYAGVKKEMFVRAIDFLNSHYVSVIELDYRQMATKAIRRCELLAEVVMANRKLQIANGKLPKGDERFAISDRQFAAWSAALSGVLDEVNESPVMNKGKLIDIFEKVLELNSSCVRRQAISESQIANSESQIANGKSPKGDERSILRSTAKDEMAIGDKRLATSDKPDTLLPRAVLIAQFAEAALSALDRYTVMVWPSQISDFEKAMTNKFTGIGIEITKEKGLLTVASLLPDTPAYNCGLDAGDVIEEVDGVATRDMSLACAVKNITGPAGTKVTLTIRRPGEEETCDITITRAKITVPTIRGWQRTERGRWLYMIDEENKIGYVRITSFSARTESDFEKVLDRLEEEGPKGLILDLRFNGGGLLDSAIEVADKFIKEGLIVSTRPRFGIWTYAVAHRKNTHPNYPLVVLINRFTVSATEIVSGALADALHNRAILVGDRTYGKGIVQGITSYPGGGARLKYTMSYWHLPSGQRVESQDAVEKQGRKDWGIGPDVRVKLRTDEFRKMIKVQRDNDVLARAGAEIRAVPLKRHGIEETLASDPQLAIGVLVLKSKLIEESEKLKAEKGKTII